jgi:hypothetical protein
VQAAKLQVDPPPALAGLAFGDADQQQGQPAQQDVGADAPLQAVPDRAQLQGGLQVAEGALGLQQVLVAKRDVLGAQVGVAGRQQELAVQFGCSSSAGTC